MTSNEQLKELPSIDTKFLDILNMFRYNGRNHFLKVLFGAFSIYLDRILEPVPLRRRKRPSLVKIDKSRWIEFLKNKKCTASSCPLSSGVDTLEKNRVSDSQPSVTLPREDPPKPTLNNKRALCFCVCLASLPAYKN